jgi:hypothetical protein
MRGKCKKLWRKIGRRMRSTNSDVADNEYEMRKVKKEFAAAKLLSRSQDKSPMERLKARGKAIPFNWPDVVAVSCGQSRRPARVHAQRNVGRGPGCLGHLLWCASRTSCARSLDKTLQLLSECVARAGPVTVHLPAVECPPESDTEAHNDYTAKVCVCARTRVLTRWASR